MIMPFDDRDGSEDRPEYDPVEAAEFIQRRMIEKHGMKLPGNVIYEILQCENEYLIELGIMLPPPETEGQHGSGP